ncbi:inositol monophosphatase family protein [Paenibacillus hamazuiensis]|uniref:inositol monophosphatase family protein n=1 Tax=Paenibacillus hamazuiensis TaxID=2936508 RepID=UPI00200EB0F7|nr:inositol monophosphatase family protein [Paenibacillus hamazuiensis]
MSHLETAQAIAKTAGAMIRLKLDSGFATEEKSSAFDVVTEVDKESERLIRGGILEKYPEHRFLGEEESFVSGRSMAEFLEEAKEVPYLWIVDPIDGTSNFVQGIPGFTVSIALACFGELELGVVYDPCADELFWAEKGKGAFLNGRPIRVSATAELARSVIATGFPSKMEARREVYRGLGNLLEKCRTIRSLGSAARHLAYVAAGRLHGFWENGLNAWDIAAGVLLIREAGGTVTDTGGGAYTLQTTDVAGSNGHIHEPFLRCLS